MRFKFDAQTTILTDPKTMLVKATPAAAHETPVGKGGNDPAGGSTMVFKRYLGDYNACFNASINLPLPSWECLMWLVRDYG